MEEETGLLLRAERILLMVNTEKKERGFRQCFMPVVPAKWNCLFYLKKWGLDQLEWQPKMGSDCLPQTTCLSFTIFSMSLQYCILFLTQFKSTYFIF